MYKGIMLNHPKDLCYPYQASSLLTIMHHAHVIDSVGIIILSDLFDLLLFKSIIAQVLKVTIT